MVPRSSVVIRHSLDREYSALSGVRSYATSSLPGLAMSLDTPLTDGTNALSRGRTFIPLLSERSDGLTSTRPFTISGCCSASRRASVPPIDRPITKTSEQWSFRSSRARWSSAYQSSQRDFCSSAQTVPCPGSRGRRTVTSRSARKSAQGRIEAGEPVNPWQRSTPTGPPSCWNGSAPGRTGTVTSSLLSDRLIASSHAEVAVVLLDPQVPRGRTVAPSGLPAVCRGRGQRPQRGPGDPREQPSVVLGLVLHAAGHRAPGDLPGQVGLLPRAGRQGPAHRGILQGGRSAARRPLGWPSVRGGTDDGAQGAQRGTPARNLSRGHPLARRAALPRKDRSRPDGGGGQGAGHPRRNDRHGQGAADRQAAPAVRPGRGPVRQADRLLPLRGHGG